MISWDLPGPESSVYVGIDAGGSSTRARAVRNGKVVFDGVGGPGNPGTAIGSALKDAYESALRDCPTPTRIAACVAGAGSPQRRDEVRRVLHELAPGAHVHVHPDYRAALEARPDADTCVIAGTGSVVCSRDADGVVHVSGGRGWILGDPGSAAWLGRSVLARYVDEPGDFDERSTQELHRIYRTDGWAKIVQTIHRAAVPPASLALAAPVLTGLAARGVTWASDELRAAMTALARTTVRHLERHVVSVRPKVALFGGVWAAEVAAIAFRDALEQKAPNGCSFLGVQDNQIDGAVRLAQEGV